MEVLALQAQLNEVRDERDELKNKIHMQTLDHQQEMKCIKWEHELENNRLKWDHEQETDRIAWDHKQTMMRVMPTAQKLQSELEQVTARLLDAQEDTRALQAKFETNERSHKAETRKLQTRVMDLLQEIEQGKERQEQEALCDSPNKNATCRQLCSSSGVTRAVTLI